MDRVSEFSWIIEAIVSPPKMSTFTCSSLLDLLQRSIEDVEDKKMLTEDIHGLVSDLGLLSQCQTVVSLLHAWSIAADESEKDPEFTNECKEFPFDEGQN